MNLFRESLLIHRLPLILVALGLLLGATSRLTNAVQLGVSLPDALASIGVGFLSDLPLLVALGFILTLDTGIAKSHGATKAFRNQAAIFALFLSFLLLWFAFEWGYYSIFESRLSAYRLSNLFSPQSGEVLSNANTAFPVLPMLLAIAFFGGVTWLMARKGIPQRAQHLQGVRHAHPGVKGFVRTFTPAAFIFAVVMALAPLNPASSIFGTVGALGNSSTHTIFDALDFPRYADYADRYNLEKPVDADEPLFTTAHFPVPSAPRNMILVIIEQFNVDLSEPSQAQITPDTFRIANMGLSWENLYSNNAATEIGLATLWLGTPHVTGRSPITQPGAGNIPSVPGILQASGYTTSFVYGGRPEFGNRHHFILSGVFDHTHTQDDFPSDLDWNDQWGVNDEHIYNRALEEIGHYRNQDSTQPFFLSLLTLSNHHPYQVPDYPGSDAASSDFERGFGYSSYQLGSFIDQLRDSGVLDDTYVVITGDHGLLARPSFDDYLQSFKVPLIILGPDIESRRISHQVSQLDIPPTMLELLGVSYTASFFGRSLFDFKTHPIQANDILDIGIGYGDEFAIRRLDSDRFRGLSVTEQGTSILGTDYTPSIPIAREFDRLHRFGVTLDFWLQKDNLSKNSSTPEPHAH